MPQQQQQPHRHHTMPSSCNAPLSPPCKPRTCRYRPRAIQPCTICTYKGSVQSSHQHATCRHSFQTTTTKTAAATPSTTEGHADFHPYPPTIHTLSCRPTTTLCGYICQLLRQQQQPGQQLHRTLFSEPPQKPSQGPAQGAAKQPLSHPNPKPQCPLPKVPLLVMIHLGAELPNSLRSPQTVLEAQVFYQTNTNHSGRHAHCTLAENPHTRAYFSRPCWRQK